MYRPLPPPGKRGFINVAREAPSFPQTDSYSKSSPSAPKSKPNHRSSLPSEPKPDYTIAVRPSKHRNSLQPLQNMHENELENQHLPVVKTSSRTEKESQRSKPSKASSDHHDHAPAVRPSSNMERGKQTSARTSVDGEPDKQRATQEWVDATSYPRHQRHLMQAPNPPPKPSKPNKGLRRTTSSADRQWTAGGPQVIRKDPPAGQNWSDYLMDEKNKEPRHQHNSSKDRNDRSLPNEFPSSKQGPQVGNSKPPSADSQPHSHPPGARPHMADNRQALTRTDSGLMRHPGPEPRAQPYPVEVTPQQYPTLQSPLLQPADPRLQPHPVHVIQQPPPVVGPQSYPANTRPHAHQVDTTQPYQAQVSPQLHQSGTTQPYPAGNRAQPYPADGTQPYPGITNPQSYSAGAQPNMTDPYPITNNTPSTYPAEPGQYPQRQDGYPTEPGQYPQRQDGYPTEPGQYPQRQDALPAEPGQYPQRQDALPTEPGQYPQRQDGYPTEPGQYLQRQDAYPAEPGQYHQRQDTHPAAGPDTYPAGPSQYPDGQDAYPDARSNQYPAEPQTYPDVSDQFLAPAGSATFQTEQNQYPEEYLYLDSAGAPNPYPNAGNPAPYTYPDVGSPDPLQHNGNQEAFPYTTETGTPGPHPNTEAYPYHSGGRAVGYQADDPGLDAGRIDMNGRNGTPPQTTQSAGYPLQSPQYPGQVPQYPPQSPGQAPQYAPQSPRYLPQSPEYPSQSQYLPQSPQNSGPPAQQPAPLLAQPINKKNKKKFGKW